MATLIPLPPKVAELFRAAADLAAEYPDRPFTLDGHIIGSIGEVVARDQLGLNLLPPCHKAHDATDAQGRLVQIKMTAGKRVALYATCERLVVLKVVSPEAAAVVFDGEGAPVWAACGPIAKNGQRSISLAKLEKIARRGRGQIKG